MSSLIVSPTNRREVENVICCISFRYSCNSVTGNDLADIYTKLEGVIRSPFVNLANATISLLSKQLRIDNDNIIMNHPELIKALIKHFNRLAESLEQEKNEYIHCIMINILSIITHIIHNSPNYEMPFNRKFIQNLFMINTSLLENSLRRKDIIRVMSVIFYDLAKRINTLKELSLIGRLRQILLQSLKLVQDSNTFIRCYKTLCKLCLLLPLTMKEIVRYRVMQSYIKFCNGQKVKTPNSLEVKVSEVESIIVDPNNDKCRILTQT